jgi:hypothetical protein
MAAKTPRDQDDFMAKEGLVAANDLSLLNNFSKSWA